MADPEQIYQEVLTEEQGKGVTPAVAEGRAKAARQRAHEGSPHPKEPKWWPGSQPQFEGGTAAPAAEAAEEEVSEPEPVESEPEPEPAPVAEAPAAAEPAPASVEAPAAQPAAAPAAAAVATAPVATATQAQMAPEDRAQGVSPGTPTGNRLRPEDSVGTDSQFEAQAAVHRRRKLLEELVSSGVPAVSVEREPAHAGGAFLVLVYLVIVALAVGFVVASRDDLAGFDSAAAEEGGAEGGEGGEGGGGGLTLSAAGVAFNTDTLNLPAGEPAEVHFINDDTVPHNLGVYQSEGGEELFKGEIIQGGQDTTYSIDPLDKGEYYFQCDVHPSMAGSVVVE